MKKKLTKIIESALPQLFNADGEVINRRTIANKIFDAIPNPEKLDLQPFETFIPIVCSGCHFNGGFRLGCTYEFFSKETHIEHQIPEKCPNGHRN